MIKETIGTATLYQGDCLEILPTLGKVDVMITSPPYAEQRDYKGMPASEYPDWAVKWVNLGLNLAPNIFVNIKEHSSKGCRSLYVYKMVMAIVDSGADWVDEFVWVKTNPFPIGGTKRLKDGFERVYQFGGAPLYPDQVAEKSKSKWAGDNERRGNKSSFSTNNGSGMDMGSRIVGDLVRPSNVVTFPTECRSTSHPAVFPIDLPRFFVSLATAKGGSVIDPFMGSGTTGVACMNLGREFIGIELEPKYFDIACERITQAQAQGRLFE